MPNEIFPGLLRPLLFGHRGACRWAPENTLPSFELAANLGADILELDVRRTRDGEVVVEGDDGISSFSLLQQDLKAERHDRMVFYVFDLMYLDGADLKSLPLRARKDALAKLLKRQPARGLRLSESLTEPGTTLLRHACKMGLEGIVSKVVDAPYRSGRGHDWVKTKCSDRQEFVVAGVVPSTADAHAVENDLRHRRLPGNTSGGAQQPDGRGGVLQPGIPGWAANHNAARVAIPPEQYGLGHAWRAACHHDPLPHRMALIGELLLVLYCGIGNFASSTADTGVQECEPAGA